MGGCHGSSSQAAVVAKVTPAKAEQQQQYAPNRSSGASAVSTHPTVARTLLQDPVAAVKVPSGDGALQLSPSGQPMVAFHGEVIVLEPDVKVVLADRQPSGAELSTASTPTEMPRDLQVECMTEPIHGAAPPAVEASAHMPSTRFPISEQHRDRLSRDPSVDEAVRGMRPWGGACNCCDLINRSASEAEPSRLEKLIHELFELHDLNGNGLLEECELIKLNETVSILHQGPDADASAVQAKYRCLFRAKFDPEGRPVPYSTFRGYMVHLLLELDRNTVAQEMIMEQFIAEARMARTVVLCQSEDDLGPDDAVCGKHLASKNVFKLSSCYAFCSSQERENEYVPAPSENGYTNDVL